MVRSLLEKQPSRNYETTQTRNHIPLETALEAVMGYGFVLTAPNPTDPMFIHLRIKVIENDYDAYSDIAKSITQIVGDRLYKGTINPSTTPLLSLQGKVILVIDNTYDPSFKTRSNCNVTDKCFELGNIMNQISENMGIPQNERPNLSQLTEIASSLSNNQTNNSQLAELQARRERLRQKLEEKKKMLDPD